MRAAILNIFFSDINSIKGVGEKTAPHIRRLIGSKVRGLLFHMPVNVIDRTFDSPLYKVQAGDLISTIVSIEKVTSNKKPVKFQCYNETGRIDLIYFNYPKFIDSIIAESNQIAISGRCERFAGILQMVHPDYLLPARRINEIKIFEPIYPLTYGLSQKYLRMIIRNALAKLPELPEWNEQATISFKQALISLHYPKGKFSLDNPARIRLAYDELLAHQLALAITRHESKYQKGISINSEKLLAAKILQNFGHQLTDDQEKTIAEIFADQSLENRMMRLIQGDVGSGKTIIALLAAANTVEAGYQAAIMAPTELLARQHFKLIKKLCEGIEIEVILLTGKDKGKLREEKYNLISSGIAQMIIGTHSLFQEKLDFAKLGLVVIDEQHRFGVMQRIALSDKGNNPDILLMSATPIPRTLTLALYGDLDLSMIKTKPLNRKEIKTSVIAANKLAELVSGIKRKIDEGEQIYWICPLIEEQDEEQRYTAAEARFKELEKIFGDQIAMVHGRIPIDKRDKIMQQFLEGDISILVATTVIEVGIDVPNASIMVIENAERFGLSQLHQLRGRVGRGEKQSSCILVYNYPISEIGKKRLEIMRNSTDGFYLAEQDMKMRGSGNLVGTKQSGILEFEMADIFFDYDLMEQARKEAAEIIQKYEGSLPINIMNLLHIFEYDEIVKKQTV